MFRAGKIVEVVVALFTTAITLYYLWRASKGASWEMRHLPALDAISDGVDRCVETGRPIYMTLGAYAYLSGTYAAMTISGVNIMRYTYRIAIRKGATPLFILPNNPEVAPLIDGIYRESAVAEGKPEAYRRENIYFFGNDEPAYRSGYLNLLAANPPSTVVTMGAITGTGDAIAIWTTRSMDTVLIGGQARSSHQWYYVGFDYGLYMTDVYSAGAIVSGDNMMISSLVAGDVLTWISFVLAIVGVVAGIAGLPFVKWMAT